MSWNIVLGSLKNEDGKDDDDDEAQQLDETDQEMMEGHEGESNNRNKRKGDSVSEHNLKRTRLTANVNVNANAFRRLKTVSNEMKDIRSANQCEANMVELETVNKQTEATMSQRTHDEMLSTENTPNDGS